MTPETMDFILKLATIVTPIILAIIAYAQFKLTQTVGAVTRSVGVVTQTIDTLEKNTNSIKDALVKTTSEASHARGVLDEKTRQHEVNQQVEEAKKISP